MVDGDREHAGDGPCKRDASRSSRTNRAIDGSGKVDAVVTGVTALRGIGGDHWTGYGCSQAKGQQQFDHHLLHGRA